MNPESVSPFLPGFCTGIVGQNLPALPSSVVDRFGHVVYTNEEHWAIFDVGRPSRLRWDKVQTLSPVLVHCLKLYVCQCLKTKSPIEAVNAYKEIRYCASLIAKAEKPIQSLTPALFDLLRTKLRERLAEYTLHRIRKWYVWMADQELPTASREFARELIEWRVPGNPKGVAVMSMDSGEGPLDETEHHALTKAVRQPHFSVLSKAIVMLCLELGANPKNLLLLEERDLFRVEVPSADKPIYHLAVPRIKKRQSQRDTKRRAISHELGTLLENLIARNRKASNGHEDPKRPILYREVARNLSDFGSAANRYVHHHSRRDILKVLHRFTSVAKVISPRTGELLKINVRRLRYTFATRMARQGTPPSVIAELLDHTDLQNVMVYVKSGPEVIERLDRALDKQLHPIISRFLGKIVNSEGVADPNNDPKSRILGTTPTGLNLGGIGTCGSKLLCRIYPPYSCYLCEHFQPWRNAPHAGMLSELRNYVDRLAVAGGNNPANRLAVQLDEVMMAMAEVVRLCTENDAAKEGTTNP